MPCMFYLYFMYSVGEHCGSVLYISINYIILRASNAKNVSIWWRHHEGCPGWHWLSYVFRNDWMVCNFCNYASFHALRSLSTKLWCCNPGFYRSTQDVTNYIMKMFHGWRDIVLAEVKLYFPRMYFETERMLLLYKLSISTVFFKHYILLKFYSIYL